MNLLPARVFRAKLDYGNYSMILKPADERSIFEVIHYMKSTLKSIIVESHPVVTISYRGCQFYLSPLEWSSYVTKGNEIRLFKAVADCLRVTFPVSMLWNGKPLSQRSVPVADVFRNPYLRVYDVSIGKEN